MAHNPFNDLYVESLEPIMIEARQSWEIASAICNREVRQYHPKDAKSRSKRGSNPLQAVTASKANSQASSSLPEQQFHTHDKL